MGHRVYESFVLLPLKLRVKFEWSIIKDGSVKFQIWSRELTTPTLWRAGARDARV